MSTSRVPVQLLVDGYNVIGAWLSLQTIQQHSGLQAARQQLTELLANYSAFRGYATRLVFDAYAHASAGSEDAVTDTLMVCYTEFGQTADTYIEHICAQFRLQPSARRRRILVATSDRAQQQTVTGYGAEWMSALQLEADVRFATSGVRQRQKSRQYRGATLMHGLDQGVVDKLTQLRFGLK